jgi:WD40 repeat protein
MTARRFALALLALSLSGPAIAQGSQPTPEQLCNPVVLGALLKRLPEGERPYVEAEVTERCAHAHLPDKPRHDTADADPEATHKHWTYAAVYSPDGALIVSGGFDRTVKLWDAGTGRLLRTLTRFENAQPDRNPSRGFVRRIAFLPDGKRVLVNADGYPLRIVALDADGQTVAAPARGGLLAALDKPDAQDEHYAWNMVLSAKGLVFTTRRDQAAVEARDVESLAPKYRLTLPLRKLISVAASDAAGLVATGVARMSTGDRELEPRLVLWRIDDGTKVREIATGGEATAIAFSADGKVLAATADTGKVRVFAVADGKLLQTFQVSRFSVQAVALNRDGTQLVTCASHAQLWDVASGKSLRHFGPFTDGCHSVEFDPQQQFVLTTSMGSDLRLWEVATGAFHRRLGRNVKPPR